MVRPFFSMRRRTLLCVALLALVAALTLAYVTAQDEAAHEHHDAQEAVPSAVPVNAEREPEVVVPATDSAEEAVAPPAESEAPAANNGEAAAEDEEAEARRLQQAQEEEEEKERQRRAAEEAEAERLRQEDEERVRQEEEARRRQAEEEEAERQRRAAAEEEERQRRAAEEEAERQRRAAEEEAERQRRAAEEERLRRQEEARKAREEAEAAARRAEAERAKRNLDTVDQIRYRAKQLPEGCASLVEKYLFRVHEQRQPVAQLVSDVRGQVNEARVNAPQQVERLEKRLAQAQDAMLQYDVQTLRTFGGDLPKTCIGEAQAWYESQPAVTSENTYLQAYTHFYRLLAAHVVTMYHTAEGLGYYYLHSYMPAVQSFTATATEYQEKAWAIYDKLFPAKGSRPEMPPADLAKELAHMAGYAAVPIGLGVACGVVAVIAVPPLAAAVLVYEYLYKIWMELFFAYYVYGMKLPEGAVAAVMTTVENVKASQWNVLSSRVADGFFDLVVDADRIFYNGIIALFLLFHVVVIALIAMCVWCRTCVPGMQRRKTKPSPLRANTKKAAAPAKKKPASPSPSDKKKK